MGELETFWPYTPCYWRLLNKTPWFLAGNGGMYPYDSPLRSPIVVPITDSSIPCLEPAEDFNSGGPLGLRSSYRSLDSEADVFLLSFLGPQNNTAKDPEVTLISKNLNRD